MDLNSSKNQEIKRAFVNREVVYCVSTLVSELSQKADEFPDYTDDLYEAFRGLPDFEEAAIDHDWSMTEDERFVNNGEYSDAETWEGLCDEQGIDAYDYAPDIYEHWIVSDWLAGKLEANNHRVLRDFFGMTVWCRPTTGQAILLDGVISTICSGMEILEGQKNEWDV